MTTDTSTIEVVGLEKSYGDQPVLRGIDLTVPTGTVYALLGPNGAGKTTTVRILSTLVSADCGYARVAGHDVRRDPDGVRGSIGVTGQFSAIDELLTGRENLHLMADLAHLPTGEGRARTTQLLARFDLTESADRRAATYSGGMKRRLDLAMTMVDHPRVIFLDEPTTGLDPRSRRELWQIVRELIEDGATVFLTTQYLEEADGLADRIGVVDGGRLVAEGTPAELRQSVPGGRVDITFATTGHLAAASAAVPGGTADADTLTLGVPYDGAVSPAEQLTRSARGPAHCSAGTRNPGDDQNLVENRAMTEERDARSAWDDLMAPLRHRWSPREFDVEHRLTTPEIDVLLEAARWAPSAGNSQPWAFHPTVRGVAEHSALVRHLAGSSASWAPAAALLVVNLAHSRVEDTDWEYSEFSQYDLGQAVAHMTIQAQSMGLACRQFRAFDREAVTRLLSVPEHWDVMTMTAIGRAAPTAARGPRASTREASVVWPRG